MESHGSQRYQECGTFAENSKEKAGPAQERGRMGSFSTFQLAGVGLPTPCGAHTVPHPSLSAGHGGKEFNVFPARFCSCFGMTFSCRLILPSGDENIYFVPLYVAKFYLLF